MQYIGTGNEIVILFNYFSVISVHILQYIDQILKLLTSSQYSTYILFDRYVYLSKLIL